MLQRFAVVGQPRGKVKFSWKSFLDLLGARNASSEDCPVLRSRKIITSSTTHTQLETRVPLGTVLRTWLRSTLLRQTSFLRSALRQPVLRTKPPSPSRIDVASIPDTHPPGPPSFSPPCLDMDFRKTRPAFPLHSISAALPRKRDSLFARDFQRFRCPAFLLHCHARVAPSVSAESSPIISHRRQNKPSYPSHFE